MLVNFVGQFCFGQFCFWSILFWSVLFWSGFFWEEAVLLLVGQSFLGGGGFVVGRSLMF